MQLHAQLLREEELVAKHPPVTCGLGSASASLEAHPRAGQTSNFAFIVSALPLSSISSSDRFFLPCSSVAWLLRICIGTSLVSVGVRNCAGESAQSRQARECALLWRGDRLVQAPLLLDAPLARIALALPSRHLPADPRVGSTKGGQRYQICSVSQEPRQARVDGVRRGACCNAAGGGGGQWNWLGAPGKGLAQNESAGTSGMGRRSRVQ
jgi:hypothetical protein